MATDDLDTPLGQTKPKRPAKLFVTMPYVVAGALGLFGVSVALWAVLANDPLGGEPFAVVPTQAKMVKAAQGTQPGDQGTQHARYDGPSAKQQASVSETATPEVAPGNKVITIINGATGTRQNVVIPDSSGNKTGSNQTPPLQERTHSELLEKSKEGSIPKIGPQGERAMTMYAHPRKLAANEAAAPKIALIIGGLGISASGTEDALAKLPAAVTFAIAPYAAGLQSLAEKARAGNHELLLQAPMEPFDYPDNDPGPQTLLTSLAPAQNAERLHWLMGRFHGYVGIVGYMGARFAASEQALAPVLAEIAKRGLIYVDNGASPRSVAAQIAVGQNFPFAKTDVVLDAVPTPTEIDHALARMELFAREHGTAVGMATAIPSTVDRIAQWIGDLKNRGVVLVPITMVALKAKSS